METVQVLVLLNLLQGLVAFTMGAVALGVGGQRLKLTKRLVATSFIALGLYFSFALAAFGLADLGPRWTLTRTLASIASQAASLVHVGTLALALTSAVLHRSLKRRTVVAVALASIGGGIALSLPGAFELDGGGLRSVLRIGVRAAIITVAYASFAGLMLLHRRDAGRSLGQWLVMGAFVVLAGANAASVVAIFVRDAFPQGTAALAWFQLAGLVGLLLLASAMLVWLQERTQAIAEARTLSAERMAHFDEASGLPNRQGLLRRIEHEVQPTAPLTLLTVRLHRYALLERTLGPAWALEALHRLGEALDAGRPYHRLASGRIDSDRLALALTADGSLADAEVLTRRREVERVALALGHPVSVSFGYAVRQQHESATTLLASACLAQEKAEAAGMHMLRFEPEQARSDADEVQIVGALYRAIGEDQLFLEYQGIYDVATGALDGVEALLRWQHPFEGPLGPGRFLPAAERGGLMGDIDRWVLNAVCRTLRERKDAGQADVPVAVNLSASSLLDTSLPAAVEALLRRNQLPAALLELEVTESAAMHDIARAGDVVDALRALGVRIALDDLGTGYSSLSHLRDLRADRLKIDRSFIAEGDRFGNAIAAAIGVLGRSLGVDVVAEGVETPAQLAFCRTQRIAKVQGWLFHRPSTRWPEGAHPSLAAAAGGTPPV